MKKSRQDAWTEKEDLLLANIVLEAIKAGKTQLEAFKEASVRLKRTSGACGFRWNATLRKRYENEINIAKNNRMHTNKPNRIINDPLDISKKESTLSMLEQVKQFVETAEVTEAEARSEALLLENKRLKEQLQRYEIAWKEMKNLWDWVHKHDIKSEEEMNK